jgi:hypothetical protein
MPAPVLADLWLHSRSWLWGAAVLFALLNVAFMIRRAPILRAQGDQGDYAAVEAMGRWLRSAPDSVRLLLFRSRRQPQSEDLGAVWFAYRFNYLIYPRHFASAWENLPTGVGDDFDLVLAFGSARGAIPANWHRLLERGHASLYAPSWPSKALTLGRLPDQPAHPTISSIVLGLIGLAVVPLLGALVAGWTCRRSPFASPWANMAAAHLVGSAALAWLVTVVAIAAGRLLIWPVYALLLLLLPGWRRARTWIVPTQTTVSTSISARDAGNAPPNTPIPNTSIPQRDVPKTHGELYKRLAVWLLIALSLVALIQRAWLLGIGWDAYSIWQLKALAFVHDGDLSMLRDHFYADYAHLDYPILVPLQTWWICLHSGGYNERWAQIIGLVYTLDMAVILFAFARRWMTWDRALMGVALVLSVPLLIVHGGSGFADIEMACWLLAVGVLLTQVLVGREAGTAPLMAWLLAGLVLVKNEGLLAVGVVLLILIVGRRGLVAALTALEVCVAYLPWLAIKRRYRLANDLLQSGKKPNFTVSLLLWRLGVTLKAIVTTLGRPGPNFPGWGLTLLLIVVGIVATVRRRVAVAMPLWTLAGLQLAGYVGIYLITTHALIEHLGSSLGRLLLHIVPTLVLASLLGCYAERPNVPDC